MNRWNAIRYAIIFGALAATMPLAAQSYHRDGSIGNLTHRDTVAFLGDDATPLEGWVGKRFVILPKPKHLQRYGYSTLRRPEAGFIIPTYDECAGKVATAVWVDASKRTDRKVVLQLDDGREYVAVSATGVFPEIAPVSDFDLARARWLGNIVWIRRGPLYEYDAITGRTYELAVRGSEPVHVQEIVAGWNASRPVRLIVRTADGREGFVDVQVTSTNSPDSLWGRNRSSVFFSDEDPRSL